MDVLYVSANCLFSCNVTPIDLDLLYIDTYIYADSSACMAGHQTTFDVGFEICVTIRNQSID